MRVWDFISLIDRFQQRTSFKVVASLVVVALGVAAMVTYVVRESAGTGTLAQMAQDVESLDLGPEIEGDLSTPENVQAARERSVQEMQRRVVLDILRGGESRTGAIAAIATATGVALAAVWLGISLSYVGLAVLTMALYLPLSLFEGGRAAAGVVLRVSVLSAAFVALVQGVRILMTFLPGPVFAIARNVVAESIRLRIGVVFLVVLVVGLAVMPLLLSESTPLRYRVQAFLQYSTSFAFWTLGFLTVLQCASSVAFEQRDKVVWQTMTKPVRPWVYLLGKLTGIAAFNAVLLMVSGLGIFLFVEHLRSEKALGEVAPYVARDMQLVTEDRLLLHTKVLQARETVRPEASVKPDDADFQAFVNEFIQQQIYAQPNFEDTPEIREQVRSDLLTAINRERFQIQPGMYQFYTFKGLKGALERNVPLTLRYKFETASKRPDHQYTLMFLLGGSQLQLGQVAGADSVTVIDELSPYALVDEETGELKVAIGNFGRVDEPSASEVITLDEENFEVQFSAGGYRANFFRAFVVLWVKLGFIAMVTITMATFLSFPVTILIAFSTLFMAEGAGFIAKSVEYYGSGKDEGFDRLVQLIVYPIARAVAGLFSTYQDINPVKRLVDGMAVSWTSVGLSCLIVLGWTAVLFLIGSVIFSKRELAIYSGN